MCTMKIGEGLLRLQSRGWAWCVGYAPHLGGYYAQAFRDLPKPIRIDGELVYRECYTEGGNCQEEAVSKLLQRLIRIDPEVV